MIEGISRPLPLEGTYNTRDLGGYHTKDGGVTRHGRYLRSDGLAGMTGADQEELYEKYGVRLVVDLRSPLEAHAAPYRLRTGILRINTPLADNVQSTGFVGKVPESMAEMYRDLLDNSQEMIANAMRAMYEHRAGCVLFHCTAGKDRTGILAMLLLKLADVPDETVIADYAITQTYMEPFFQKQTRRIVADVPSYVFESRPESMAQTLLHLQNRYGGSESYLRAIGLTAEETEGLKENLLART